jgi:hypothetical protein
MDTTYHGVYDHNRWHQHPAGLLAALFEGDLQGINAFRARGIPDPGDATALQCEFHMLANKHANSVEDRIQACIVNHTFADYYERNEHRLHAAFAQYVESASLCIPNCNLSTQSQSALATLHHAIPQEKRDDEWHAIDLVLRARERERGGRPAAER